MTTVTLDAAARRVLRPESVVQLGIGPEPKTLHQRLHRELLWAQFKNGKPVFLDLTILPLNASADGKQS